MTLDFCLNFKIKINASIQFLALPFFIPLQYNFCFISHCFRSKNMRLSKLKFDFRLVKKMYEKTEIKKATLCGIIVSWGDLCFGFFGYWEGGTLISTFKGPYLQKY